jgi:hypothetical protein
MAPSLNWRARLITTPNNDTLYSSAFLDPSRGPVAIHVPRARIDP